MMSEMGWLFVTGCGRSGTSPAGYALNYHPDARILHESCFAHRMLIGEQTQRPVTMVHNTFGNNTWHRDADAFSWDPADGKTASEACITFRQSFPPVKVFGDKAPWLMNQWREVRKMLPGSKFIIMDRSRDEIIASHERRAAVDAEFARIYALENYGLARIDRGLEVCRELAGQPDTMVVSHEMLQTKPTETILSMLAFAALDAASYPFDEALRIFDGEMRLS